jgi:hypothetical protein
LRSKPGEVRLSEGVFRLRLRDDVHPWGASKGRRPRESPGSQSSRSAKLKRLGSR